MLELIRATATFTRPANTTQYAVGDIVANDTTAGSVSAMSLTVHTAGGGGLFVPRCKLTKSDADLVSADFRVHLFGPGTITAANGDNGAFSVSNVAQYFGAMDVTMSNSFTDGDVGFGVPIIGNEIAIVLASGKSMQALLEARGTYTPGSAEVFTLTLDCYGKF